MKKLHCMVVFTWMLIAAGFIGTKAFAANHSLPDSLITDEGVYEYTFSDFDKAKQIMHELRQRNKLPEYKLDVTEGDLYFNTGHYHQALKFYKRALENDSVRLDNNRLMEQLHRMISLYDCMHDETRKAKHVDKLLKKAEECGNKEMKSVALFNMGKMLYYQGDKDKGYQLMQRAAVLMEETGYKYKYDNLRYNYNTLLTFQQLDQLNEEALHTLDALLKVVAQETGTETPMAGLNEKEKKAMYAHYAIVLLRLGRKQEAQHYYKQFLSTAEDYDRDNYLIMPYLFDCKMYDDVVRMNAAREKILVAQGDTVTYHMTTIKKSLGQAYADKGDYRTATRYFKELAVLRDSIKSREQKSSALELATLYETHEKDLIIQQQIADANVRNLGLWLAGSVVFLLSAILWFVIRYNWKIQFKNNLLVETIEELLGYKDELFRRKGESLLLKKQLQVTQIELQKRNDREANESPAENNRTEVENSESIPNDQALFDRVEYEIINQQLFLQPDFSRDKLMAIVRIPKNKFSLLFKQYAGMNFSAYINELRLEYAAKILKEYPEYSIDSIAKSCGISSTTTFYRLFVERFGMTPAEYRRSSKSL